MTSIKKRFLLYMYHIMEGFKRILIPSIYRRLCLSGIEPCTAPLLEHGLSSCMRNLGSSAQQNASEHREDSDQKSDENIVHVSARVRTSSGSRAAAKLRESGRVPGTLFSRLPGSGGEDRILLSFDKKEISSIYQKIGSYGWGCQVCNVVIESDDGRGSSENNRMIRALGRQLHVTAATAEPENVTLIGFPSDRKVKVDVPLKTFGREVSPGIRAGGRVNWIRRTIPCIVEGTALVPQSFEVDISNLKVNDKVLWTSLDIPSGVTIVLKDERQPILKMARK